MGFLITTLRNICLCIAALYLLVGTDIFPRGLAPFIFTGCLVQLVDLTVAFIIHCLVQVPWVQQQLDDFKHELAQRNEAQRVPPSSLIQQAVNALHDHHVPFSPSEGSTSGSEDESHSDPDSGPNFNSPSRSDTASTSSSASTTNSSSDSSFDPRPNMASNTTAQAQEYVPGGSWTTYDGDGHQEHQVGRRQAQHEDSFNGSDFDNLATVEDLDNADEPVLEASFYEDRGAWFTRDEDGNPRRIPDPPSSVSSIMASGLQAECHHRKGRWFTRNQHGVRRLLPDPPGLTSTSAPYVAQESSTPAPATFRLRRSPRNSPRPRRFQDEFLDMYKPKWWMELCRKGLSFNIPGSYRSPFPMREAGKYELRFSPTPERKSKTKSVISESKGSSSGYEADRDE